MSLNYNFIYVILRKLAKSEDYVIEKSVEMSYQSFLKDI